MTGADGLHDTQPDDVRVADLRFRFGVRDLRPKMVWVCPLEGCVAKCGHDGADEGMEIEDGQHITLVLEHVQ